MRENENINLP